MKQSPFFFILTLFIYIGLLILAVSIAETTGWKIFWVCVLILMFVYEMRGGNSVGK